MLQQRRQQLRHSTAVNGYVMAFRAIIYASGSSCYGEHDVPELSIYVIKRNKILASITTTLITLKNCKRNMSKCHETIDGGCAFKVSKLLL